MNLITGSMYPQSIDTIEKQTIYNLEALKAGIFTNPDTNLYPHNYTEAEAVYAMPVIAKREIWTPTHGMRLIYSVAFPIWAGNGFNANGVWNHALPMSLDLVL